MASVVVAFDPVGTFGRRCGRPTHNLGTNLVFVDFWDVDGAARTSLPMSIKDICDHLTVDWAPSLPPADGTAFMGWPPFLIEGVSSSDYNTKRSARFLALRKRAARSERQWKSVLSWMLGVAGARHFLRREGYTWVAPLSAFYRDAVQRVDVQTWPPQFPRARLVTDRKKGSRSRLRPDYIAVRPVFGSQTLSGYEWAVAEAKGVASQLSNKTTCPARWYAQARNVTVTINGSETSMDRHLVVATRVNPNATRGTTRRLQIRAWNRREKLGPEHRLPPDGVVDIASAHLFGMFRSLRLRENAVALALAVQLRAERRRRHDHPVFPELYREGPTEARLRDARNRARTELAALTQETAQARRLASVPIETDLGRVQVEIAEPLIVLAETLQEGASDESATLGLLKADTELELLDRQRWGPRRIERRGPIGLEVRVPDGFDDLTDRL